jgi:hypothetical protein
MSNKKAITKPIRQLITDDDMSWMKNGQYANINKISGDELLTEKMKHSAKRFKQSMVNQARRTNKYTNMKHFTEELDAHASRHGWWEYEHDSPLMNEGGE